MLRDVQHFTNDDVLDMTEALDRIDLGFALLLPEDNRPLGERATAFGRWSRGFLSGFGLSGIADLRMLSEDARGFLRDLERFGSLAIPDSEDEDDERAFTELIEFTRMGVLVLRDDVFEIQDAPDAYSGIQ